MRASDIGTIPIIIKFRREGQSRVERQLSGLGKEGIKFKVVMRCESPESVKELVRRGAGMGFLYYNSIKRGIERGRFKVIEIPGLDLTGQSYIVSSKEKPLSRLAGEFLSFLRTSFDENRTHQTYEVSDADSRRSLEPPRGRFHAPIEPSILAHFYSVVRIDILVRWCSAYRLSAGADIARTLTHTVTTSSDPDLDTESLWGYTRLRCFSEPPKSRLFCCDRFSALNPDVGKPPSGSTAEMVVVIHQAIGIDLNLPQPGHVGEQVEKSLASCLR